MVLLSGDAGIGKSRLVQVLKDHIANDPHVRWECRSAEYSQNTALFPLVDLFQRILQFQAENTPNEKLAKLEQMLSQYRLPLEESMQLFAPLLSVPLPEHHYPPLNLSPQRNDKRRWKLSSRSSWNLPNISLSSLSSRICTGGTPRLWSCLDLLLEQTPTASILWC